MFFGKGHKMLLAEDFALGSYTSLLGIVYLSIIMFYFTYGRGIA